MNISSPHPSSTLSIRPVQPDDYAIITNFVNQAVYSHRHLDWRDPQDWIGEQPFLIAETGIDPLAVLACPPDIPGLSWLRFFSCFDETWLQNSWKALLESSLTQLKVLYISQLFTIAFQDWYQSLLMNSGFQLKQEIVVLEWKPRGKPLPDLDQENFQIRLMKRADLEAVAQVDQAAFAPQWVNTLETLSRAIQQSAYSTVVEQGDQIIGYTISTGYPQSAHLARIAVEPSFQKMGAGKLLLIDLMKEFSRRGVTNITVNTQSDNQNSLRLYHQNGFLATGENYPVYCLQIA